MNVKLYLDETKAKNYLVVTAGGTHTDLQVCGKELRNLILPGQRALHMKDERDQRRRAIADTITRMADLGITATVYDAGRRGRTERDRRRRCLEAIVTDASALDDEVRITFDLDQSLLRWDRQQMIELTRDAGTKDRVTYLHSTRQAEVLLAIPDAIAWCWARGGAWRRRVEPIVADVRRV